MANGSERRGKRPGWRRRVLVALNIMVGLCLLLSAFGYAYVRYRLAAIHTQAASHLSPTSMDRGNPAEQGGGVGGGGGGGGGGGQGTRVAGRATGGSSTDGLTPENILLIGNQTRAGLTNPKQIAQFGNPQRLSGSLSDVIMIMHLDPARRRASILSVPRDLLVPMPAGSPVGPYQKIDAALNDGRNGPNNLIAAITDDLGIPINHYVEVNFNGFERTVNALGGIRMDFPRRLFDAYSLLHITHTGCQLLNGAQALALVRSRHLQYDPPGVSPTDRAAWPYDPESDLARIVRDHVFLRVLVKTAQSQGLGNPLQLNRFLSAVTDQVTMDPGLRSQLITLALHYRHVVAGSIPETTLPVTTVGYPNGYSYDGYQLGEVDFPVQPADNRAIRAWDSGALPAPVEPRRGVEILDATGTGTAASTAARLTGDGLRVAGERSVPVLGSPSETFVRYHPGQAAQAEAVVRDFSGAVLIQPDRQVPAGRVQVELGTVQRVVTEEAHRAGRHRPRRRAPTAGGQKPSSARDQLTPYDPRPCR